MTLIRIMLTALVLFGIVFSAHADEEQDKPKAQGWDMVSDTVAQTFNKANALLTGNLDLKMALNKPASGDEFTRNAIGQKVPKGTAVKSAGSLHSDQPL
jgi:hypothetical protein